MDEERRNRMISKKLVGAMVAASLLLIGGTAEASHPVKDGEGQKRQGQKSEGRAHKAEGRKDGCGNHLRKGDRKHSGKKQRPHRLVHSEAIVQAKEGFATHITDHGKVTSIKASTITIERADGKSVSATTSDQTRICRDGKAAKLSDLKAGDQAGVIQIQKDSTTKVKAVRASSEES